MIRIDIAVQAGDWTDKANQVLERAGSAVMNHLGFVDIETELSVLLTDDEHMTEINAQWRDINKPTNVLSFPAMDLAPGDRPGAMLGDVVFAYQILKREADDAGKAVEDHLFHLAVHGLLHCLGYDHAVDSEAETMENLEKAILAANGIGDPYMMPDP